MQDADHANGSGHADAAQHVEEAVADEASEQSHDGKPLEVEGVGSFTTLFAAIEAAGLKDTLSEGDPFTVFAPTDEAFAALPDGTLDDLLKPENKEKLASILTFHVVSGRVTAEQVVDIESADTVNGKALAVVVADSGVTVGEANVLKTDIECEVGLIHAIDRVLIP
ncbi:MAG: fasciclin domain-containing protein [Planctomycetaceae bacterium]|nr:fasciclin domain-containing protein [Planctomycetaceae bacterium]